MAKIWMGWREPSVYFNAANGPWRIALAYYQEGPVDYSAGKRGTWFDRPELEVHYQFLENDDFSFGLTGEVAHENAQRDRQLSLSR